MIFLFHEEIKTSSHKKILSFLWIYSYNVLSEIDFYESRLKRSGSLFWPDKQNQDLILSRMRSLSSLDWHDFHNIWPYFFYWIRLLIMLSVSNCVIFEARFAFFMKMTNKRSHPLEGTRETFFQRTRRIFPANMGESISVKNSVPLSMRGWHLLTLVSHLLDMVSVR